MRYGDKEAIEKLESDLSEAEGKLFSALRELNAARFINTSLAHAIEKAKGHAGEIDEQILIDIVEVRHQNDALQDALDIAQHALDVDASTFDDVLAVRTGYQKMALALRVIITDDPDWLEVTDVHDAWVIATEGEEP